MYDCYHVYMWVMLDSTIRVIGNQVVFNLVKTYSKEGLEIE